MTTPTPAELAILFHDTYEHLAPSFGYETRTETRKFDPTTPNGRLMIAVCGEILSTLAAHRAPADPSLTVPLSNATTDSAHPIQITDPAQAHAAEMESLLVFFQSILYELWKRSPNRWSIAAERQYEKLSDLLTALEAERKQVTK